MDDPDHTRNPAILEEGVLPSKCSVCVMGILEAGSDYCSPPWLPPEKKKKSKNNSSGVKAAVRWQPVQRGARCRHPSVPSVRFSEGQSSAALHVAAVLFTSLWKPITSLRCCASQSCYISHTNTRKRALTQTRRAHAHTHTHTDQHLQQQLLLAAVEGRNNAFWPVCGEIYRCAHMEQLFTAQVHQEAS